MRKFSTFGAMGLSAFLALIGLGTAFLFMAIVSLGFKVPADNNSLLLSAAIGAGAMIGLVIRR